MMTQWSGMTFWCMLGAQLLSRRTLSIPNYPLGCQWCSLELLHASWGLNFDWHMVLNTEGITFTKSWSPPPIKGKVHAPFPDKGQVNDAFSSLQHQQTGQKNFEPYLEPFVSPITHLSRPSRWAYYNGKSFNYLFMSKKPSLQWLALAARVHALGMIFVDVFML